MDLPMAVGMQQLQVVGCVWTATTPPNPMVNLAVIGDN
jgi:hypothetical protein